MDQDTLNKKRAGAKYSRNKFNKSQPLCEKHNLPCHLTKLCRECVRERLPEIDTHRRLYIDPVIMDQLEVKEIKRKPKMKKYFST